MTGFSLILIFSSHFFFHCFSFHLSNRAFIGIIILSAIANRFRLNQLSRVDQFVMSYGGLRGAVAFALALLIKQQRVESQPMFVTTTIAVIYFTVFLQGITIKPLVKILNVKRANKKKPTMNERIHERVSDIISTIWTIYTFSYTQRKKNFSHIK